MMDRISLWLPWEPVMLWWWVVGGGWWASQPWRSLAGGPSAWLRLEPAL